MSKSILWLTPIIEGTLYEVATFDDMTKLDDPNTPDNCVGGKRFSALNSNIIFIHLLVYDQTCWSAESKQYQT